MATNPMTGEWLLLTPPENWYVQIGPFKALPTTPLLKVNFLKCKPNFSGILPNIIISSGYTGV